MDKTLIIGLGNPDPALEETYHNVGALAVQWIAEHAAEDAADTAGEPIPRSQGQFCICKDREHISSSGRSCI